jgi:hypothetical protein
MSRRKKERLVWRQGQTVWVFDPKPRRWMIATVQRDVRAVDYYCSVRYFKEDNDPEYARLVMIAFPRPLWNKDVRPLHRRPHAVGAHV